MLPAVPPEARSENWEQRLGLKANAAPHTWNSVIPAAVKTRLALGLYSGSASETSSDRLHEQCLRFREKYDLTTCLSKR